MPDATETRNWELPLFRPLLEVDDRMRDELIEVLAELLAQTTRSFEQEEDDDEHVE